MKISLLLLMLTVLKAYSTSIFSQNATVSINMQNVTVREVVVEIEKQGGISFLFNDNLAELNRRVSVSFDDTPIKDILENALSQADMMYEEIKDDFVVLLSKPEYLKQPQITITGRVTDVTTGEPLPGASIIILGTTTGTTSDIDGYYSIRIPGPETILVFSFVGYTQQEIFVGENTVIDISLRMDVEWLDEIVVVGYGTQRRENLTGSVSEIRSDQIGVRTVNTATQALSGLSPNFNVDVSPMGGESDAAMNMNIRGIGSLSSSNPYILIDGARASQTELAALNARDIESISILRDAAASAIYGAQAAYGVILIQTKKGDRNRVFEINYTSNMMFKDLIYAPNSVSSVKWAEWVNEASMNLTGTQTIGEEAMALIQAYFNGEIEHQTAPSPHNPNQWLGLGAGSSADWTAGFANNNWMDIMYKDIQVSHNHNINVRGGSNNVTYYISGGYFHDPGQLNFAEDLEDHKRYNFTSNVTADVFDWLEISNNTRFSQINNSFPNYHDGDVRGRLYHDIRRWPPVVPYKTPPVIDTEGNILVPEQLTSMPGWTKNNGFTAYDQRTFVSTLRGKISLIPNELIIVGDYTFRNIFYDETFNYKKWDLLGPDGQPNLRLQTSTNQIRKDERTTKYTSFNVYVDYKKSFLDNHNINVLGGIQQEENFYSRLQVARTNVLAPDLNSINVAAGDILGPHNPMSTWGTVGIFGRLSYNYQEKYLLESNIRYDGTSRFPEYNRWGLFPSISLGYNIHRERYWESISHIFSIFRLRGSYGKLGNQEVASYLHLPGIPVSQRLNWIIDGERPDYAGQPNIVSPHITWENSFTTNFGVDLGFLDNRLLTTFDIYERITENMFGPSAALPSVLGTSPPRTNSASLVTKGWELEVNWRDKVNNDLSYYVTLMLADNISRITEYHNPDKILSQWYVGQTIGEIWGWEADELFQTQEEVNNYLQTTNLSYFGTNWQPGNVKYKDLTGDGKVDRGSNTLDDHGDMRIIGNSNPRYRFSLQGGITWKQIDLRMLWEGIGKRDFWVGSYNTLFWGWNSMGHSTLTEACLDHWRKDNPGAYLPIQLIGGGASGFGKDRYPSTRYLQDASFIRLRSLNIGYSLPGSIIQRVGIKNARVYFNGENLVTFTKLWENLDPELAVVSEVFRQGPGRAYPLSRTLAFGLDVTF